MKRLLCFLALLLPLGSFAAGIQVYEIGQGDTVNGGLGINVVQRLYKYFNPAQLSQYKLVGIRIEAEVFEQTTVGLYVNRFPRGNKVMNTGHVNIYMESPQLAGQYGLQFNGFADLHSIKVELQSLQPQMSEPLFLDQFHAGRYDSVTRNIQTDPNRGLGEIIIEIIGNDVEINNLYMVDVYGNKRRVLSGLEMNEGSRRIIPFQGQFQKFRFMEIEAENQQFWGRKGEVKVSVRYWD